MDLSQRNASTFSATIPNPYALASTIAVNRNSFTTISVYSATDQMVEPDGVTPPKTKFTKPAETQTRRHI